MTVCTRDMSIFADRPFPCWKRNQGPVAAIDNQASHDGRAAGAISLLADAPLLEVTVDSTFVHPLVLLVDLGVLECELAASRFREFRTASERSSDTRMGRHRRGAPVLLSEVIQEVHEFVIDEFREQLVHAHVGVRFAGLEHPGRCLHGGA